MYCIGRTPEPLRSELEPNVSPSHASPADTSRSYIYFHPTNEELFRLVEFAVEAPFLLVCVFSPSSSTGNIAVSLFGMFVYVASENPRHLHP